MKIILLIAALLTPSAFAFSEGNERGNGGDEYAKEFRTTAEKVLEHLQKNPIPGVKTEEFRRAIENTTVGSKLDLYLRGALVDAINYPSLNQPHILLSRSGWDRMASNPHRRLFLVLHEYLGIMGVDDSGYHLSRLLDATSLCSRNEKVRNAVESAVNKYCMNVIPDDLEFLDLLSVIPDPTNPDLTPAALTANDLVGMARLHVLYYLFPLNSIDADTFSSTPKLNYVGLNSPPHIPQFNTQSTISTLMIGDPDHKIYVQTMTDNAFAGLTSLASLQLDVNAFTVDLTRALGGMQKLQYLGLRITGVNEAPAALAGILSPIASLKNIALTINGGNAGQLKSSLENSGWSCKEKDINSGEQLNCSR